MWCCEDLTPEEIAALSDDEREIIRVYAAARITKGASE